MKTLKTLKYVLTTIIVLLVVWLAYMITKWTNVNWFFSKVSEDPCLDVNVSMDNSVREINESIWACQVKLEQTWLEYDNLAKQRDNELKELKELNDARRAELERWKTELLGN